MDLQQKCPLSVRKPQKPKNADHDQLLSFNVSIPLDKFLPQTWANYGMNASSNNGTTYNVGLNRWHSRTVP